MRGRHSLAIPDPRLVHYGSYETVFLKRMRKRHGGPREGSAGATAIEHAVNLLSFVFARIYFPTFSNGLKAIAGYLGFRWSGSPVSGLEAIVWRRRWEASRDFAAKLSHLTSDFSERISDAVVHGAKFPKFFKKVFTQFRASRKRVPAR